VTRSSGYSAICLEQPGDKHRDRRGGTAGPQVGGAGVHPVDQHGKVIAKAVVVGTGPLGETEQPSWQPTDALRSRVTDTAQ
jgi:hypothetical protein